MRGDGRRSRRQGDFASVAPAEESPFFAADRAAYWRHLRGLGPVVKIDMGKLALRGYYLTSRDDVRAALLHPVTFVSPPKTFKISASGVPLPRCRSLSGRDRSMPVSPASCILSSALKGWPPTLRSWRARATTLVDMVAGTGQCDAVNVADTYACQALLTGLRDAGRRRQAAGLIRPQ